MDGIKLLNYDELLDIYGKEKVFTAEQHYSSFVDRLRLVSVYDNKLVPSILFDSKGTIKIISLASYILDVLQNGKTLIIDELDGSLHFKIVREIISLFNNDINNNVQLIASVHDVSLLDCKYMFRKEQIWFLNRMKENNCYDTELYSLAKFNCNDDGIRSNTDLYDKLSKGLIGSIPDPDLISWLIDINVD